MNLLARVAIRPLEYQPDEIGVFDGTSLFVSPSRYTRMQAIGIDAFRGMSILNFSGFMTHDKLRELLNLEGFDLYGEAFPSSGDAPPQSPPF